MSVQINMRHVRSSSFCSPASPATKLMAEACTCSIGTRPIPTEELTVAQDLYAALQAFFAQHAELQSRPLFITGESYAGKYVPAIGEPV